MFVVLLIAASADVSRRAVVPATITKWGMPVRYDFDVDSFGDSAVVAFTSVLRAIRMIEKAAPGVSFQRSSGNGTLKIVHHDQECSATIGFQNVNFVQLTSPCAPYPGIVAHELLHSLGFIHEQDHPNRSTYLEISTDASHYSDDWQTQWIGFNGPVIALPFDPCSLMMYPVNSEANQWADHAVNFTDAGVKAAERCVPINRHLYSFTGSVGDFVRADPNNVFQRQGLSARDIAMLNVLYPSSRGDGLDQRIVFWFLLSTTVIGVGALAVM